MHRHSKLKRIRPTNFGGYNRLFKNVSGPWFMVCAHKNPSVLEMKYNIVDKVIPVEFLSDSMTGPGSPEVGVI